MDLQSILNDEDSETSSVLIDGGGFGGGKESILRSPYSGRRRITVESDDDDYDANDIDIEDILRENEDDDDDEGVGPLPTLSDEDDDDLRPGLLWNSSTATTTRLGSDPLSHNPEDWAVLQHILNEDEDHEDEEDVMIDSSSLYTTLRSPHISTRFHPSVDTWVKTSSDDDDQFATSMVSATNMTSPRKHFRQESSTDQLPATHVTTGVQSPEAVLSHQQNDTASAPRKSQQSPAASPTHRTGLDADASDSEEQFYRRSLSHAQLLERKLLKSGHRDIVSPLTVKRRLKPRVELSARATARAKQQMPESSHYPPSPARMSSSSTSMLLGPRFNFSGIVDDKPMSTVSASIVKHSQKGATKVYCGLPTCLAFNSKFIAVGTQNGIILIYDLFEVLRQRLGGSYEEPSERNAGSITSLDLSPNGDAVVAGYVSGVIALWDTIRGLVLRSVTDAHPSPITAVRFLKDFKVVSVDSSGLVNKMTFAKNLLWANYSVDTECLLDGTAGQILAVHVLPPYAAVKPFLRPEALARVLRNLTLISLSSERSSFVVAVDPKVHVLHRWARPPADRTCTLASADSPHLSTILSTSQEPPYLPCIAWGWALLSGGGNVVMPILARGWGCCLQLLCARFPTQDLEEPTPSRGEEAVVHWPAFGIHHEIDAKSPIVSLEWLNERSLAYLTASYEFALVDTVMMTLLERLDFSNFKLVYAEFTLSRAAEKLSGDMASVSGGCCTTFLNSTRCSDDRIMIICQDELRCISIVGARRRISALEADGEWLEALAFALDHYENAVLSQEDRRRDPNARKDLTRHPEFSMAKTDEEEWIAKLLVRYLNLAVENAPDVSVDLSASYTTQAVSSRIDLAQSHFQMLAGVCVEFCVTTRRLDLLFGPIFRRFESAGYVAVFLDVLEPYVLNDKLKYIAPEAMSYLVEHFKSTNGIASVERCLLHMDCTIMDFDSILTLLRTHEMYSALFYVFNQGLDDYVTPLEIILEKLLSEADIGGATAPRRRDGVLQNDFERLGFKALLYIQACFNGKTFPKENLLEPDDRAYSVKAELLRFLLQERYTPSSHVKKTINLIPEVGQRSMLFPYFRILLLVDPRGMLHTISIALDSSRTPPLEAHSRSGVESVDDWVDGVSTKSNPSAAPLPDLQEIMIDIAAILLPKSPTDQTLSETMVFRSRGAVGAYLDFAANFVINGTIRMEKSIVFKILSRVAGQYKAAGDSTSRQNYQRKTMEILSALSRDSYDPDKVLAVFNDSGMHRAALLLHQQVASSWNFIEQDDIVLRSQHFLSAIDCYVEDDDPLFRMDVFQYIKKECSGVAAASQPSDDRPTSLRDALFTRLAVLVDLDALLTARLVAELLVDDLDHVIDALSGKSQFMFLQVIVSGELVEVDPVAGSVLNLTMDHHHTYLTLMAKLHPEMVYDYLSTHDNYRTEECLRLCEEHDIADASAYLLERMGQVTNALQLILQTLETRMMGLKRTIRGLGVDVIRNHTSRPFAPGKQSRGAAHNFPSKLESEVDGVRRILIVALDLCERNSGSFVPSSNDTSQVASKYKQSELWFSVLDRLINAKGFLRLSKEQPEHAKLMSGVLSELLRLTMQRMVSSVPLSDLVRKVTADHSGSQIGELREMVEGLLATYGFELKVVKGAVMSFYDDVRLMKRQQHELHLQGASVHTLMNADLSRNKEKDNNHFTTPTPLLYSGVLRVSGRGNATAVSEDRVSSSRRAENGLIDAMKRLRSRRGVGDAAEASRASTVSMLTVTDHMFYEKETEPVVDVERLIGVLGEAEHRGRLIMTFNRF
jgi:vacuolar protein sorting-associated protein 8